MKFKNKFGLKRTCNGCRALYCEKFYEQGYNTEESAKCLLANKINKRIIDSIIDYYPTQPCNKPINLKEFTFLKKKLEKDGNLLKTPKDIADMNIVNWSHSTINMYLSRPEFNKYRFGKKFKVDNNFINELKNFYIKIKAGANR